VNSVLFDVDGLVSMAAENAVGLVLARVVQSSRGDLRRHAEPPRVEPVNEARDGLALEVELLQLEIERSAQPAEAEIVHLETIELVAVNRDVAKSVVLPSVVLVDADSYQVRHDVGESVIVVTFHPDDFDVALGIGELPNIAEKLPVALGKAGEVEVGKDVAQQDEPLKTVFLEHARGFAGVAGLCTEVQIGKDQRVVAMQIHNLVVARECYEVMKCASKSVQW
jgi:hypothetical protein